MYRTDRFIPSEISGGKSFENTRRAQLRQPEATRAVGVGFVSEVHRREQTDKRVTDQGYGTRGDVTTVMTML